MVRVWLVSGGYNLKPARALKQSNKNVRNGGYKVRKLPYLDLQIAILAKK
jgi:hypothetical protein